MEMVVECTGDNLTGRQFNNLPTLATIYRQFTWRQFTDNLIQFRSSRFVTAFPRETCAKAQSNPGTPSAGNPTGPSSFRCSNQSSGPLLVSRKIIGEGGFRRSRNASRRNPGACDARSPGRRCIDRFGSHNPNFGRSPESIVSDFRKPPQMEAPKLLVMPAHLLLLVISSIT